MTNVERRARCETPNHSGHHPRTWQAQTAAGRIAGERQEARSELIQRLLAEECELCGLELTCEVHHIRKLADLNQPGRKEKPLWVKRMAMRRRKPLIVRQKRHEEIHRERPSRRKSTIQITGKPT